MTQENIPLQQNEEITPIQGYEGLYSITSFGRVWSHKKINRYNGRMWDSKFLVLQETKRGYFKINLIKGGKSKTYRVHRLVAQHFIPNPQNLPDVNHEDTNKQNNYKDNLEWRTKQENENHASINGLRTHKKYSKYYGVGFNKSKTNRIKSWRVQIRDNKKCIHVGSYYTEIEAAKAYNDYVIKHNLDRPLNELN